MKKALWIMKAEKWHENCVVLYTG